MCIGVWNDFNAGKVFVSQNYDKSSQFIFAMTLQDHSPNTMMYNSLKKFNFWKTFVENYKLGNVYFESYKIKHDVYELLRSYISR